MKRQVWVRQQKSAGRNKYATVAEDTLYTDANPSRGEVVKVVDESGKTVVHGTILQVGHVVKPTGDTEVTWDLLVD